MTKVRPAADNETNGTESPPIVKRNPDSDQRRRIAAVLEKHRAIQEMMKEIEWELDLLKGEDEPVFESGDDETRSILNTSQASQYLGLDRTIVSRLTKAGYIPATRSMGTKGHYRFKVEDLAKLKQEGMLRSYAYRIRKWPGIKADHAPKVPISEAARNVGVPTRVLVTLAKKGDIGVYDAGSEEQEALVDLNEVLDQFPATGSKRQH